MNTCLRERNAINKDDGRTCLLRTFICVLVEKGLLHFALNQPSAVEAFVLSDRLEPFFFALPRSFLHVIVETRRRIQEIWR
jgi:hypothetical protein